MRDLRCLICVLAVFSFDHYAAQAQWIQTNGPYNSGSTNCFAVLGTNLIAGTDSGVFRSSNSGVDWVEVNSSFGYSPYAIIGASLFAGNNFSLFQSTDSGATWIGVNSPNYPVIILAASGTELFAGTYLAGVYRSTDSAQNWTDLGPAANIYTIAVIDTNLFAGAEGSIYRTSFGSASWTNWTHVDSGLGINSVSAFAVIDKNLFAATDRGVFLTTDNGASWTHADSGLGDTRINAFAAFGTNLFVGTNRGVFLSADSNTSWVAVNTGLTDTDVTALTIDAGGYVYAGTQTRGVFRSVYSTLAHVYEVSPRWNLISVPILVGNRSKTALFPTASSNAFTYDGHYFIAESLQHGRGYWLRFPSVGWVSFTGSPVTTDTIPIQKGWNMIGSLSNPISVNTIGSDPPGIVTSNFYGYNSNYFVAVTLEPAQGYWVKANQSGKLILSSSAEAHSPNVIRVVATSELPPEAPENGRSIPEPRTPDRFALEQNYPNPFNPSTEIRFRVPLSGFVSLKVCDVLGREVATLVSEELQPGHYEKIFNANGLSSGVYFYQLKARSFTEAKKLILLK